MARLTKRVVESTQPDPDRDVFLWDSLMPGFGVRIKPTGVASYLVDYRNARGRKRRVTIGKHGVFTCEEAREHARSLLNEAALGGDPADDRDARRRPKTLADVWEIYLAQHLQLKRKPSTASTYEGHWRLYIRDELGDQPIDDIRPRDIQRLHASLPHIPVQANRMLATLSAVLNYAERLELRPQGSNPCRFIERYPEKRRERFMTTEELQRLGEVLAEAERSNSEHPSAILAVRLLALTGMRKGEVQQLRWQDVDPERGFAFLPDSKTGRKAVPLSQAALDLINEADRLEGNPYVCPGDRPGAHFVGLQKMWERVRSKAKLGSLRLHDLRHTFASHGAAIGLDLFHIGKVLGHSQTRTTQRYAHLASHPLQEAANRIGGSIAAALYGAEEGGGP